MESVLSMLAHAKLPKEFWVEALSTATYVINKSPSVPLDGDTPQKVWTGKPPGYKARIVVKVPTEEGCGLRRDICPGSKDDLHPNGAEYCSQHAPRGRAVGREDGIPSRCREDFRQWCEKHIRRTKSRVNNIKQSNILNPSKFNILVQKMKILKSFRMQFTT